jgi:hypothetical protein
LFRNSASWSVIVNRSLARGSVSLCSGVAIFWNQMLTKAIRANASSWYSYFRWCLLNTLSYVTSHNNAHTPDISVIRRSWLLPTAWISIDTQWTQKRFSHFFIAALLYTSSSIPNVCERDWYSKTQNVMFAHCFVAGIHRCDMPTIHRDKHLTHNDNA